VQNKLLIEQKYLEIEVAEKALEENLGLILEEKPLIIQFGKK